MASLLHSDSRRLYSWWWDSHISPKNSKWLQENLTDMDTKVKAMIKLIEEDADSFARRAEMYYKKRPELMKLVEEFYRAYRALAERYDHATVELRHAHRTMAEAFPNQLPYELADESPSGSLGLDVEPHTPEMPHPMRAYFDSDDSHMKRSGVFSGESDSGISKRGLKQLNEIFESGTVPQKLKNVEGRMRKDLNESEDGDQRSQEVLSHLSSENQTPKNQVLLESGRGGKAESEVQSLKKMLAEIQAEKEALLLQYKESLKKLSSLARELHEAQTDAGCLDERANKAETEIRRLKEVLAKLESERDAGLLQYNDSLERISILENAISQEQENAKGLNERAFKAEIELENLKLELSVKEAEKEAGLLRYQQCLEMISSLENKISLAEENARMLNQHTARAESEVNMLKEALAKMKEEKDAAALRYEQCLEIIAKMEGEISRAQEDSKRLNNEILEGATKLKSIEENCILLERSNQSLHEEAESLVQKIEIKDQELSEKQKELEKIQTLLKEEQSQFAKVEAALLTLQKLHSQSQEEQRALTLELQSRLQMLKELEISNHALEEDIQQMKAENHNLNELNSSAASSINSLQDELLSLKEIKEKLETEVSVQMDRSNALQKEVNRLEEEIQALNGAYQGIMQQLLSAGLNPEFLESSVKELRDENSKLRDVCDKGRCEKESLYEKLRGMDDLLEKNAALRISLSELSGKLEGSREMVQELQKSCQYHRDEKSTLVAEKATLLSQLQITTGNMQKLLEKNTILENSLSVANAELEGLRTKSKCLEEFCQLLKNEKSDLLSERSNLVSQLENVEQRLSNLEKRFTKLEEKYANLEKEKESTLSQVEELRCSLNVEQHERACYVASSESRLGDLESHVYQLQEEGWSRKKEFEEELDKAVKAQVEIFILQKFIKDLEEKNLSSLIDCQKHVEATKLSDKLIRELESENLEQQIEAEFLLDEIEKLRTGIFQIFRALQFDSDKKLIIEPDHLPLPHIFDNVEDLKASLLENMDEKQQLLVENSVLLTLLQELKLEGTELELDRKVLKQEAETMEEQNVLLQRDRNELLEMNKQLMLEMSAEKQHEEILNAELETQRTQLASMHGAYLQLQEENFKQIEENRILLKKFLDQKEEMSILEEENMAAIQEAVTLSTLFLVLKSFSIEKSTEIEVLAEEIHNLRVINNDLKGKFEKVVGHLENKEVENLCLNGIVKKLKKELHVANDLNEQLNCQVLIQSDFLKQKAIELLDVEQKLKAVHNENADLYVTLEEIKAKCEESKEIRDKLEQRVLELRKDSNEQKGEIERLHQLNENLGSEICVLQKEAGERRIREENLSSELQERSNEFELWEAEAASFYFDFQVSAIGEALLQNKVHELSKVCETLEDEKAAKSTEIGRLKERVDSLENEIGGLKTQLSAYVPVIASLRDSIASLEQNAHLRKKLHLPVSQKETISEVADKMHDKSSISLEGNQDTAITTGVSELLEIQGRLRAVEKAVLEEMDRISRGKSNRVEDSFIETKLKSRSLSYKDTNIKKEELQHGDKVENQKSMKMKPEISEMRNGALMKDIPLDQVSDCSFYGRSRRKNSAAEDHMLELWVSAEQDRSIGLAAKNKQKQERASVDDIIPCPYTQRRSNDLSSGLQAEKELGVDKLEVSKEPKQGARSRKVLERLASDARKLTNLQTNVQDLKKKLDTYKRSKKANKVEHERVMGQLLEVGEAIMELTNINGQLTQDIEEGPAGKNSANLEEVEKNHRKTVTEQAQKTSEKIGRLQFEVQSIQYLLLKLEDECKTKEKSRFSGVLLRDFIYSNRRRSIKRKKARFCGCMRPSTSKD